MTIANNPISGLPELTAQPSSGDYLPVVNGGALKRVAYEKLVGAPTAFTPTLTNLSLGNGILNCRYARTERIVYAQYQVVFGATTTVSGLIGFSTPFTISGSTPIPESASLAILVDAGTNFHAGVIKVGSQTRLDIFVFTGNSTIGPTGATVPFTWAMSDRISFSFHFIAS